MVLPGHSPHSRALPEPQVLWLQGGLLMPVPCAPQGTQERFVEERLSRQREKEAKRKAGELAGARSKALGTEAVLESQPLLSPWIT